MEANIKICNLDVIAPVAKRELVLNGKTYEVKPATVARFIELSQLKKKQQESKDIESAIEIARTIIKKWVPEIDDNMLEQITMEQMQLIFAFISDELPEDMLAKGQGETEKAEKSADKKAKEGN